MSILVIAEHHGGKLNISTARTVHCATAIGGDIHVAVLGHEIDGIAGEAAGLDGVSRILAVSGAHLEKPLAANLAPEIAALAGDYSHVLGPSTTFGKDIMPRVAALLGVNQVSDIMSVEGERQFKRPTYAGNAIVDVAVPDHAKVVATARAASWSAVEGGSSADIEKRAATTQAPGHTRYVGLKAAGGERPDLQSAPKVVSGGRALGSAENFDLIFKLADRMGAGVGASRAAVDAGYVPNDMQVGQTGKIIAPELYMAFGISGAIQHVTGIKDAGTIVAVNKDAEAPIFEIADIGLVGDLFSIIPEIQSLLD